MHTLPPQPVMYDALTRSDPAFEGVFWLGVKTTGIFCRPTCTARKPKPENVEYFPTTSDAARAGYRPCLRCRPLDPDAARPAWLPRLLAEADARPTVKDADLARLGIDPATVRRYFNKRYHMTFIAYQRARRMRSALQALKAGASITRAALDHAYESESGFREAFERTFDTSPANAHAIRCLTARWIDSPLGAMLAVADDEGLRLLEFVDRRSLDHNLATLRRRLGAVILPGEHPALDDAESQLAAYFNDGLDHFTLPTAQLGSPFQHAVWDRLAAIPHADTVTYTDVARDVDRPGAVRAVANACAANNLAVVVPCHRVLRADGHLGGYAGALWRKQRLLDAERACAAAL